MPIAGLGSKSEEEGGAAAVASPPFSGTRKTDSTIPTSLSNQGDYQRIFQHKVTYLYLLKPGERMHLLNHYINYCQAQVLYYNAEAEDFVHDHDPRSHPAFVENVLDTMRHRAQLWEAELAWVMQMRVRESARIEQETSEAGATGE